MKGAPHPPHPILDSPVYCDTWYSISILGIDTAVQYGGRWLTDLRNSIIGLPFEFLRAFQFLGSQLIRVLRCCHPQQNSLWRCGRTVGRVCEVRGHARLNSRRCVNPVLLPSDFLESSTCVLNSCHLCQLIIESRRCRMYFWFLTFLCLFVYCLFSAFDMKSFSLLKHSRMFKIFKERKVFHIQNRGQTHMHLTTNTQMCVLSCCATKNSPKGAIVRALPSYNITHCLLS